MRSLPFVAFFVSGASSLIFQTLWTRLLHHVFGATSVAISSVLTVFMAGLGLGAYLFGRWGDRIRRPLLTYAFAELGVGVCGLIIPLLVRSDGWLATVNAWLRDSLGAGSFAFMLARFACVVPILILPTTLMGATLPLLARHFVQNATDADSVGARVGTLYAINTLGAVAGTALGAFVLMPSIGVWLTNVVAAGMNLSLAAVIWVFRDHLFLAPRADAVPETVRGDASLATPAFPRWVRVCAVAAFGLSGTCALGYEVVWSRALAMAIGSSVHAFALILETFLIGIALGSAALSPLLDPPRRVRSTTLLGALGEAVDLRVALLVALGLTPIAHADVAVRSGLAAYVAAVAIGWGAAVIVTMFGVKRSRDAALLDAEGPPPTTKGPAMTCLALPCAGSLWHVVGALTEESSYAQAALHGYLPYIAACVVALIAGFAALLIATRGRLLLAAASLQLYIALATFGSYLFQDEIPYTFARLVSALDDLPDHVGSVRFFMFFSAALCTLPATLGMGAMFPLTLRVWSSGGERVAADVGTVYTSNTLGSIVGSWLPGFVLMPWIGMESTLQLGILVNLALALLMAIVEDVPSAQPEGSRGSRWPTYLLACGVAPLGALMYLSAHAENSPVRWNLSHMTLGAFRVSLANDVLDPQSWGEPDLVYYRDGVSTTVSVEKWGRHLSMKNNGKVDASNGDDMPTQIMVAAYPLLLHPQGPEGLDVALVGFGSGVTVGATLQFPIAHVDTVELEASVVEAAVDYFHGVNHLERSLDEFPYVQRPRLTVHADDGRNFLAASDKKYDVIVSEPSNPWITGVSDLFTVEHFTVTKRRLAKGGVYCQWVQLYELSPANIKTIYRTFATHFEHVAVFAAEDLSSDTILLGSDEPLAFSLPHVAESMRDPRVRNELERAYVHAPQDVFARILFSSRSEVMQYARIEQRKRGGEWHTQPKSNGYGPCPAESCRRLPAPLNTDDNMRIEFAAPRDLIGFSAYEGYLGTFYGESWPYGKLFNLLERSDQPAADDAQMAMSLAAHGRKQRARRFAQRAARQGDDQRAQLALRVLEALTSSRGWPRPYREPPAPGPQMDPQTARALDTSYEEVLSALGEGEYGKALAAIEDIPGPLRLHSGPALRLLYGYLLWRGGGSDRALLRSAVFQLEDLIRTDPEFVAAHPEAYFYLSRALDGIGSYDKAVRNMRAYVEATHSESAGADEPGASPPAADDQDAGPPPESDSPPQPGTGQTSRGA